MFIVVSGVFVIIIATTDIIFILLKLVCMLFNLVMQELVGIFILSFLEIVNYGMAFLPSFCISSSVQPFQYHFPYFRGEKLLTFSALHEK